MGLRPNFVFSQSSLQDYLDCPRRFELRHVQRVHWPALESEPALVQEKRQLQGQIFHRMVQQHLLGVPAETLTCMDCEPDLARWWHNYITAQPGSQRPGRPSIERELTVQLGGYRLAAKYDYLNVTTGESALIIDWKTSAHRPSRAVLQSRIQTRVYLYVLVTASPGLNAGTPLRPDQVSMTYWFAEEPLQPVTLQYSQAQYEADQAYLKALVQEILATPEHGYWMASTERPCRFCNYRSLCDRGVHAGQWDAREDAEDLSLDEPMEIDLDQLGEIAF
ncbi:MAG: PD-(D/E)XK nuclease family protein [Anaerolineaceae bacterium]|nr:PD-(D/E)XK nuclease family protein [Anaerolineaceae bacterium]